MSIPSDNAPHLWREQEPQQQQQAKPAQAQSQPQKSPGTTAGDLDMSLLVAEDPHGIEPFELPPLRPDTYIAARLGRTRPCLRIDTATQGMQFPAYHALHDVLFDGDHQATIILLFHTMTVEIRGEFLWPVAYSIAGRRCEAIHQYHRDLYDELPPSGKPLINEIIFSPPRAL